MRLLEVSVKHFRGLEQLRWVPAGATACLLGPGDSGKSTLLDAVEIALSPRFVLPVTDADFHGRDFSQPIEIEVTVGDLPEPLLRDDRFGFETRGWDAAAGRVRDEPLEGDDLVLSIRLRIDQALEASWVVFNDRIPEGRPIGRRDRELLHVARIGAETARHYAHARTRMPTCLQDAARRSVTCVRTR